MDDHCRRNPRIRLGRRQPHGGNPVTLAGPADEEGLPGTRSFLFFRQQCIGRRLRHKEREGEPFVERLPSPNEARRVARTELLDAALSIGNPALHQLLKIDGVRRALPVMQHQQVLRLLDLISLFIYPFVVIEQTGIEEPCWP